MHAVQTKDRPSWRAQARVALIAQMRHTAESSAVAFTANVQPGDPAGVILQQAQSKPPDLIVLGTYQRTCPDRLRIGSIAAEVARQATQPVLIVPAGAISDTGRSFERIVVAVDFSSASNRAIKQALALSSANGRVTLVHVVPGSSSSGSPHDFSR